MLSKQIFFGFVVAALFSSIAFAGHESGGGAAIAGEFIARGHEVLHYLMKSTSPQDRILSPDQLSEFLTSLSTTRVEVVETPLQDPQGLEVDAVTIDDPKFPGKAMIELNHQRWTENLLADIGVYRLVFHEFLRVLGVKDDNFVVSRRLNMKDGGMPPPDGTKLVAVVHDIKYGSLGGMPSVWDSYLYTAMELQNNGTRLSSLLTNSYSLPGVSAFGRAALVNEQDGLYLAALNQVDPFPKAYLRGKEYANTEYIQGVVPYSKDQAIIANWNGYVDIADDTNQTVTGWNVSGWMKSDSDDLLVQVARISSDRIGVLTKHHYMDFSVSESPAPRVVELKGMGAYGETFSEGASFLGTDKMVWIESAVKGSSRHEFFLLDLTKLAFVDVEDSPSRGIPVRQTTPISFDVNTNSLFFAVGWDYYRLTPGYPPVSEGSFFDVANIQTLAQLPVTPESIIVIPTTPPWPSYAKGSRAHAS